MLAALLKSDRPLIVLDLETTGVRTEEARIVELAHEVHRPDGSIAAYRTLIRPGVPLGPSVAVHGISEQDLAACRHCARPPEVHTEVHPLDEKAVCDGFAPYFRFIDIARNLARGYSDCDFAGKNVRFDLRVLAAEMRRAGVIWSYAGARVLDADRLEGLLEPRDLSSLYRRRLGREPEGAHRADNDVRMTVEILRDQIEKRGEAFPLDLAGIHQLSWPGWIDSEGRLRRDKDGVVTITFGKHRGTDVRKVPRDYWQWCAGLVRRGAPPDFGAEFAAIAKEMALGRFPGDEQ